MSSTPDALTFINTSPLLYLHQVGQLGILPKLYGTVIAPTAVEQELAVGRAKGVDVPDLNLLDWLQIRAIDSASTIPNVIDKAKQAGYLADVALVITKLQEQGMWLTESVIQAALKLTEEIE